MSENAGDEQQDGGGAAEGGDAGTTETQVETPGGTEVKEETPAEGGDESGGDADAA